MPCSLSVRVFIDKVKGSLVVCPPSSHLQPEIQW